MPSRRELLSVCGVGAAGLALGGCDRLVGAAASAMADDLPTRIARAHGSEVDEARHLLDRAAYGPSPGDIARVRAMGTSAWIDEQLEPDGIADTACDIRTAFIDTMHAPADLAFEMRPEIVERDLTADAILRATYSRRQLYEVMVGFWTDHFNVALSKAECQHLTALHVRDAIRGHALGRFDELLRETALSPAMLVYLDGRDNAVSGPGERPNENYARELLELHTLGAHGGYTQRDVMEAARCLTGWVVRSEGAPGSVAFVASRHDDGDKEVLGHRIERGLGAGDLDRLLTIITGHPSCARYVCHRLCRRFISDDPPDSVVDRAAARFEATRGDIRETMRVILNHDAFVEARSAKIKRPFRFVISALRALHAETHARSDVAKHLAAMGHAPYQHPTPDGYPEETEAWLGTMLPRFRFALALCDGGLDDTDVDIARLRELLASEGETRASDVFGYLVGRAPDATERRLTSLYQRFGQPGVRDARLVALTLSSPAYQRC